MKKVRNFAIVLIAALVLLICGISLSFGKDGKSRAYAYTDPAYAFAITSYTAVYDVRADRTVDVMLDLGIRYLGYASTGFIHHIPVNDGDRVRNVKAYELDADSMREKHLDYDVTNEYSDLVSVDMGDHSRKTGEQHYYRIRYTYAITKPADKNVFYHNAVGFGSDASISNVSITYRLPDGLNDVACYVGSGSTDAYDGWVREGNAVTLSLTSLSAGEGVTFEFGFDKGVLSVKPDMTPYWIIIAGCVILGALFAVKFLRFNSDGLVPVTNTEAPDDMDPLAMGKLIDNKVDMSDVTSLIYYWASKGYLKIDMTDQHDIALIRISRRLPDSAPKHQQIMYEALFKSGELVKINDLKNSFYTTVSAVTKEVNSENSKLYDGKSMGVSVLFALLGALLMCVTPIVLAMTSISAKLFVLAPVFMIIPAFIVFALAQSVKYNLLKHKKRTTALMYLGLILLAAACTAMYAFFVPSYIIELVPKLIMCAIGFAIVILSTLIISRTEAYTEKLNKIIGFRNFILYAEKDKLELMLKDNPEFYYNVLPYAIVLGVSDIWENKFEAITVAPPSWATGDFTDTMFNIVMFNSLMRSVSTNITTALVSRPSSGSYSGGGFGGGSFGGFGGGGHGGGGFSGR